MRYCCSLLLRGCRFKRWIDTFRITWLSLIFVHLAKIHDSACNHALTDNFLSYPHDLERFLMAKTAMSMFFFLIQHVISIKLVALALQNQGEVGCEALSWRQTVIKLLLGRCIVLLLHSGIAFASFSFRLGGCEKFLKIPSLVTRTSNVLQLVTGRCQSLRLAYDEIHLSIEIVYSDLPPAVSTSLNIKAKLLWKIIIAAGGKPSTWFPPEDS